MRPRLGGWGQILVTAFQGEVLIPLAEDGAVPLRSLQELCFLPPLSRLTARAEEEWWCLLRAASTGEMGTNAGMVFRSGIAMPPA